MGAGHKLEKKRLNMKVEEGGGRNEREGRKYTRHVSERRVRQRPEKARKKENWLEGKGVRKRVWISPLLISSLDTPKA